MVRPFPGRNRLGGSVQTNNLSALVDFSTDSSKWILHTEEGGTKVMLDWNPRVDKPVVKLLSPVLKPVFEWNHHWAMNLGEKQLAEYLQTQSRVR